jgi:asparagine synthase (glutamine-hydrolysing)
MCGIAGYLSANHFLGSNPSNVVRNMISTLAHRGPDDEGVWIDPLDAIALGHRRLSIIDISAAGKQPMVSESGRYVLVFNGEIYNHIRLRGELPPRCWKGHSDTETLLAAIEYWGLRLALTKCVGMFALALWDSELMLLSLSRDRLGEKPLYYGWQGADFLFGSELKAFKAHPSFKKEIDRDALGLYVSHGYVPAPFSIFQGIQKLQPGSIVSVSSKNYQSQDFDTLYYWSLESITENIEARRFMGSPLQAVTELEGLVKNSIAQQCQSDVPLGAFLSGGVDSSTVVAVMQSLEKKPVHTFSIGFNEINYDESRYAKLVSDHLKTKHTEFIVTPKDALNVIPDLPWIYDEPFADPSQIPTILLSRLASQYVKVSLSGDGGDELFGGYSRYEDVTRLLCRLEKVPKLIRSVGGSLFLSESYRKVLSELDIDSFYAFSNKQWKNHPNLVINDSPLKNMRTQISKLISSLQERMMYADSLDYLPNDILVKVDRASMSCGLETRVPLLDHRIVEFAWSLPYSIKAYSGVPKWPLKQILYKYVPNHLIDRPKMGFGVPLGEWLRGPLRKWAENLLDEKKLKRQGLFDPTPILKEWELHMSGRKDRHYGLWTILMFQAWLEQNT